jgi:hypothetical protein
VRLGARSRKARANVQFYIHDLAHALSRIPHLSHS